jgi:hypothetical protein
MGISHVWVYAQLAGGAPTAGTLELLTKARSLGGTVSAFVAGDGAALAAAAGAHGATTVYATGDLGGRLPGVAAAAAMKALIDGGTSPDVIMFPQNYEGRDAMSRLSVRLDRTVLTNNVDVAATADGVAATTPIFGGNLLVTTAFSGAGPHLVSFRPKSFAAEPSGGGPAEVKSAPVPDLGPTGAARVVGVHVEHGPQARRGQRRRLRRPRPRRGGQVLARRGPRQAAEGRARRLPRDRRRGVGAVLVPGGPDRQGREARRLHRGGHLRRDAAHGRDEGLQAHHRDQQGQGGPDLRDRGPGHRRRRAQGPPGAHRGPQVPLVARQTSGHG